MNPVFEQYGLKDLLPLKLDVPDEGCTRPNASMYCFDAGKRFNIFSRMTFNNKTDTIKFLNLETYIKINMILILF